MSESTADPLARETPAWYDAAKLGIFIHWSVGAVPAYAPLANIAELERQPPDPDGVSKFWRRLPHAIAYQNALLIPDSPTVHHHAAHHGELPYEAFAARFRDELLPACDPGAWADLCARAGARYVVLTTKHQDGFALWPSAHRNPHKDGWQSQRDVVGETAEAVRAHGMRFGTYYCAGLDGAFGPLPITGLDSMIAALPQTQEYLDYVTAHWRELIERYEPSLAWNDYAFPGPREHLRELLREYVRRVPDGVVNNRFQERAGTHLDPCPVYSDFVTPEYSSEGSPERKWEMCRSIGLSFGYNALESERTYMSAEALVHLLADVVARGGNLLLNVNPTATGEIPWGEAQRLLALGWWLRDHGEAIFDTRPWERNAGMTLDGQPVRYTRAREAVHAIVLGTPPSASVELDVALAEGAQVTIPGHRRALAWEATPIGVRVQLPQAPPEQPALSLRISPPDAVRPV